MDSYTQYNSFTNGFIEQPGKMKGFVADIREESTGGALTHTGDTQQNHVEATVAHTVETDSHGKVGSTFLK